MIAILDMYGFKRAQFIHKFLEEVDVLIPGGMPKFKTPKRIRFEFDHQIDQDTLLYRFKEDIS